MPCRLHYMVLQFDGTNLLLSQLRQKPPLLRLLRLVTLHPVPTPLPKPLSLSMILSGQTKLRMSTMRHTSTKSTPIRHYRYRAASSVEAQYRFTLQLGKTSPCLTYWRKDAPQSCPQLLQSFSKRKHQGDEGNYAVLYIPWTDAVVAVHCTMLKIKLSTSNHDVKTLFLPFRKLQ